MIFKPLQSRASSWPPVTALVFFLLVSSHLHAQVLDRVVAVVNDEIITLSELDEAGKEFIQKIQSDAPKSEQDIATRSAQETILNQLINQRLISQQAEVAGVNLSDLEFDVAYQNNLKTMNITPEVFQEKLMEAGLSEETYKTNLRNQLLRDKLILYEVRSKVIVTEEMIMEYYDKEYSIGGEGKGYYLLQMGFTWGESEDVKSDPKLLEADKVRARKRAEEIRGQIEAGADFGELAKKYSNLPSAADGGDLGVFMEDELAAYMKDSIVGLKAGDVSKVVETPNGYQFFKLLSSQEGGVTHSIPLFEVREDIQKKLFEEKFKEEYTKWVDSIKKGAYVKKML